MGEKVSQIRAFNMYSHVSTEEGPNKGLFVHITEAGPIQKTI